MPMQNRYDSNHPTPRRRGHIADALAWTRDISGRCARTVAIGSHRLLVENHTGILELTPERVVLDTRCGAITVTGRDLALCDARRGALIVRGCIERVALPPEGGAALE